MRIIRYIFQLALLVGLWCGAVAHAQEISAVQRNAAQEFLAALHGESEQPIKCGLSYILNLRHNFSNFPSDQQHALQSMFQRPDFLPESYVSSKGHFKIHYTTSGINAVSPVSTKAAGVPDYVYEAARAAERSYFLLVDSLGFRPNLPDEGIDGPEYDIYIMELGNVYGWTFSENAVSSNPLRYTAYMKVDNDFVGPYFTHGLDALRVTIAHEFFHAIQFAYAYRDMDLFFFEMSSVWFEDLAYDGVNDYLQYLPKFFRELHFPLHLQNNWHEYGAALWLKYWLAHRDLRSLRRMWEKLQTMAALKAMQEEVQEQGVEFPEAMAEFYSWCLYTGPRHQAGQYFPEAEAYPTVSYRLERAVPVDTTIVDSVRALSARFYLLGIDSRKSISVILNASDQPFWRILGVPQKLSGTLGQTVAKKGPSPYLLKASDNEGSVVLVAVNGAMPDNVQVPALSLPLKKYEIAINAVADNFFSVYPNPLIVNDGAALKIAFQLEQSDDVQISIFSEQGNSIFHRDMGIRQAGFNQFNWNGKTDEGEMVSSGIYIVLLKPAQGAAQAKKVAIIRP